MLGEISPNTAAKARCPSGAETPNRTRIPRVFWRLIRTTRMKGLRADSSLCWLIMLIITTLLPFTVPSGCFQDRGEGRGILRWTRRSTRGQLLQRDRLILESPTSIVRHQESSRGTGVASVSGSTTRNDSSRMSSAVGGDDHTHTYVHNNCVSLRSRKPALDGGIFRVHAVKFATELVGLVPV